MAGTVKSKTDLDTAYADQTSGAIGADDGRDVIASVFGEYGEISIQAASTAQTGISTTPAKVTGWNTNGQSDGMTPDHATDNDISVSVAGLVLVMFSISFTGTASTKFSFEVYKNTAAQGQVAEITLNATPDGACVSGFALVSVAAGDNLELYVYADGASKSITPTEGQFVARRIG